MENENLPSNYLTKDIVHVPVSDSMDKKPVFAFGMDLSDSHKTIECQVQLVNQLNIPEKGKRNIISIINVCRLLND